MSFKRVAGHNLEFAWHGPSADEAPPLVFLHGGLGSLSLWRDFPAALCARTGCGGLVYSIARMRDRYDTSDLRARLGRHHANVDRLFAAWTDVWLSPEFRDWNIENYLPGIHSPTIVIQGLDDEYGTPLQVDAMTTALGNRCETVLLADCGHTPHVDRRAAVETAVAGFVERLVNNRRI